MKWYEKKIFCFPIWAVGVAILAATAAYAQRQTLELVTYLPAPYGEYNELRVRDRLEVFDKLEAKDVFKIDLKNEDSPDERLFISSLYDLSQYNQGLFREDYYYRFNPNDISRVKEVRVGDPISEATQVVINPLDVYTHTFSNGEIIFGGMRVKSWPVVAKPGYSSPLDKKAYSDLSPSPAIVRDALSVKIYYGTYQNPGAATEVELPSPGFRDTDYFVMILPRDFKKEAEIGKHRHEYKRKIKGPFGTSMTVVTVHTLDNTIDVPFTYYAITDIKNASDKFTVSFDGGSAIPSAFDWIAIGN